MPKGIYKRKHKPYWLGKKRPDISLMNTGRKLSEETKKKISIAHTGLPSKMKGKKLPELTGENARHWKGGKPKCGDCNTKLAGYYAVFCKKCAFKGSRNSNFVVNREELIQSEKKHLDGRYRGWMKAVKDRDEWVCRIADNNCNGRLEAHHILRWSKFPELRYEVNNGITLCHFHHPLKIKDEMKLAPYFRELVKEN